MLRLVPRARRDLAIPQGSHRPAHGCLIQRNAEFRQPPAHHPVHRRDRSAFDQGGQGLALVGVELRRRAGRRAVNQPVRPLGVEPHHPVADDLPTHPADPGRLPARAAVIDHRQRQKAPRLVGIVRRLRKTAKRRTVEILPKRNRRGPRKPPCPRQGEAQSEPFENPPRESPSAQTGISNHQ